MPFRFQGAMTTAIEKQKLRSQKTNPVSEREASPTLCSLLPPKTRRHVSLDNLHVILQGG